MADTSVMWEFVYTCGWRPRPTEMGRDEAEEFQGFCFIPPVELRNLTEEMCHVLKSVVVK